MIEQWFRILCDNCENPYTDQPVMANPNCPWSADSILRDAELDGWKVYRLVKDIYYGKALCPYCWEG